MINRAVPQAIGSSKVPAARNFHYSNTVLKLFAKSTRFASLILLCRANQQKCMAKRGFHLFVLEVNGISFSIYSFHIQEIKFKHIFCPHNLIFQTPFSHQFNKNTKQTSNKTSQAQVEDKLRILQKILAPKGKI